MARTFLYYHTQHSTHCHHSAFHNLLEEENYTQSFYYRVQRVVDLQQKRYWIATSTFDYFIPWRYFCMPKVELDRASVPGV